MVLTIRHAADIGVTGYEKLDRAARFDLEARR